MGKLAMFGGTFNPFHNGHLEIVNELLCLPEIEKIVVIPTRIPPHKAAPLLASGEDRINMCRLALCGFDRVEVSDIELNRKGPSYTYDTVCELSRIFNMRVCITCGADMITTLDSWYRYDELIKAADIIAFRRCGVDNTEFDNAVDAIEQDGGTVTVIEKNITDISSSRIREQRADLVPASVKKYIEENGLYGE